MTNAPRRLGVHRRAQVASTFTLIAVLMSVLFAFRIVPAAAQSQAAPGVWLIERIDDAQVGREEPRSLKGPSLVIDADQQPHLIYSEEFDGGLSFQLIYATKTAGAWITRTVELNGGASPALALTTNSQLRAAYLDRSDAGGAAKYGQSTDGSVWTAQPATTGFNWLQPSTDLALDRQDRAHIVVGSQESISGLSYRMSLATQSGSDWAVQPIADGNGIAPTVAVDVLGQVHVSYRRVLSATRSVVSYAVLSNGVWLTETVGDPDDTAVLVPSRIAVDANNVPHIAYTHRTRNELVYASRANGGWTRHVITGSVEGLDLMLDAAGLPHIAYIEPTAPARLVYAAKTGPNGTWISSTVTAGSRDDPGPPVSLALGPTGLPFIAYTDSATGDIRVARLGQAVYVPLVLR